MVCHSDCKDHLNQRLHACNFLTLRNKESVIIVFELLSFAINVHILRKNGEIKKCQSSQDVLAPWSLDKTKIS